MNPIDGPSSQWSLKTPSNGGFAQRSPSRQFWLACNRQRVVPTRFVLIVNVASQSLSLFEARKPSVAAVPGTGRWSYAFAKRYRASTSRIGIGQQMNSNRTPLGLHRIAEKVGAGFPIGTVFRDRKPIGLSWDGCLGPSIVHRIFWLDGLEPGFNRGGRVDTRARCIYIHGIGDETTLGRPASQGCVHLPARDLIPLFDVLPIGTLVWIEK
jgi:L,D-transpeptidase catalytic domain